MFSPGDSGIVSCKEEAGLYHCADEVVYRLETKKALRRIKKIATARSFSRRRYRVRRRNAD